jgi:uncharacterized small protein (DUF1192 family)
MNAPQRASRSCIHALVVIVFATLGIFGTQAAAATRSQSQSQQGSGRQTGLAAKKTVSASQEKPKPRKVWTEDDLASIRKPWDVYQDQEAQSSERNTQIAARPDGAQVPATTDSKSTLSDGSPIPETVQNIEARISTVQQEILQITSNLAATKQAYRDATDDLQRSKLRTDIDLIQGELQENTNDLDVLQARLEAQKKDFENKTASSSAASGQPQSQN